MDNPIHMASSSTPSSYLRCAVIWEQILVDERLFQPGARVTIGESSNATFTLPTNGLGKRFGLLAHSRKGAVLSLKPGMKGWINLQGQAREIDELLRDEHGLAERNKDAICYTLSEGDSGLLVFGRVGLRFDFVSQIGQIKPARFSQIVGIDQHVSRIFGIGLAFVTILALVSRLFAGSSPDFVVEQIPERFVTFVVDDPLKVKEFRKEMRRLQDERTRRNQRIKDRKRSTQSSRRVRPKEENAIDAERERIRKKVADKGLVAAMSRARKEKGALADVLEEGGLGMSLEAATRSLTQGAARARMITAKGAGGIPLPGLLSRPGTAEALGEGEVGPERIATGRTGRSMAVRNRLADRQERQVRLDLSANDAQVTGGTLSKKEIAKVILGNKGSIRYCYENQLSRFPTLRGKLVVDFIIELDGSVRTVRITSNNLSVKAAASKVASCLNRFIRRWRFPTPKGGKVRVIYPFSFGRTQ